MEVFKGCIIVCKGEPVIVVVGVVVEKVEEAVIVVMNVVMMMREAPSWMGSDHLIYTAS